MEAPKAEWRNAPDFAEVAEALGCNTVDIMAVLPDQVVLFTPHPDDSDPGIYSARLGRDADGILRAGPRRFYAHTSTFIEEADKAIGKALRENLGPPLNEQDGGTPL